ncbi:MAG: hypothetical protein MUC49_02780 [Raineya sp.]|jgi:hypothetical protein|nr:hypothetical protein [Raineya sp.]
MFSFFSKKPSVPLIKLEDKVWMNTSARLTGLLQDAQIQVETKPVLVVYFFERTENTLQEVFKLGQKPYVFVNTAEDLKDNKQIHILSESAFHQHAEKIKNLFASKELVVMLAEHYPLNQNEDEILFKLGEISLKTKAYGYIDFDDPILKMFGGERILELLKKMGIKESESISHNLVSKSIKEAKKKIGEKVKHEQKGISVEDWFNKNKAS